MTAKTPGPTQAAPLLATLLDCPPEVLDVSLDQLRTLAVVHATGSAKRAARVLGREQSSVQKQLDALNRIALRLVGEALFVKQGRDVDFLFTPTGRGTVNLSSPALAKWIRRMRSGKLPAGSELTCGVTTATVDFLGRAWPALRPTFDRHRVHLKVQQVSACDLWTRLDDEDVDLVCASVPASRGKPPALDRDYVEWQRDEVVLVTNLGPRQLSDAPVDLRGLRDIPLLLPTCGPLAEFVHQWFGPHYREVLTVIGEVDSFDYGRTVLASGLLAGAMLSTEHAAARTRLRSIPLRAHQHPAEQIATGVFARADARSRYPDDHPLNLVWHALRAGRAEDGAAEPVEDARCGVP